MSCQERVLTNKFNEDYRFCSHSSCRIQSAQHNFLSPEFRQLMKEIWRQTDRGRLRMEESEQRQHELVTYGWDIMINVIPTGSEELPSLDRNTTFFIYDKTSWNEIKLFLIWYQRWSTLFSPFVSWLTSIYLWFTFIGSVLTPEIIAFRTINIRRVHNHVSLLSDRAENKPSAKFSQSRRRPLLGPSPGWKTLLALALSHLRHNAKHALTHGK